MDPDGPNGQSFCQSSLVLAKVAIIWGCEPCPCPVPALALSQGLDGSRWPLMTANHAETKCQMSFLEGPGGLVTIKVKFGPLATSFGAVKLSRHEHPSFASASMGLTPPHDDNQSQNWLECSLHILKLCSSLTCVRDSAVLSRLGP
jgi:hypothetical protein